MNIKSVYYFLFLGFIVHSIVYYFDADLDPAFHSDADPDPASQNDADSDSQHAREIIFSKSVSSSDERV
jgi:hypothetical protein